MKLDLVFRGCTRPAVLFGVPMIPCFVNAAFFVWLATTFKLGLVVGLPIVHFMLQQLTKKDDLIFELLWLRFKTYVKSIRNPKTADTSVLISPAQKAKLVNSK
jgi:type IV secretion system protein VirB3